VAEPATEQAEAKAVPAEAQPEPAPKKKRGFWGRVFGIGKGRE
jgi:hypothetical protein